MMRNKGFDNEQLLDAFSLAYENSKRSILQSISGLMDNDEKEEFLDQLFLQLMILWYVQKLGFLNADDLYFITKFNEINFNDENDEFNDYYDFLIEFFEFLSSHDGVKFLKHENFGKILFIKPLIFFISKRWLKFQLKTITMPNECFYKKGLSTALNLTNITNNKRVIPLLNLLEILFSYEGKVDDFFIGNFYEKLLSIKDKKKHGIFYTPKLITNYISKNTIINYLIEVVNNKYKTNFQTLEEILDNNKEKLEFLLKNLGTLRILDPAVGSGHFLSSTIRILLEIYDKILENLRIKTSNFQDNMINLFKDYFGIKINELDVNKIKFDLLYYVIIPKNIYGVDIDQTSINITKARLFLLLTQYYDLNWDWVYFPETYFNLRTGNSLIGVVDLNKDLRKIKQLSIDQFIFKKDQETSQYGQLIIEFEKNFSNKTKFLLKQKDHNDFFSGLKELFAGPLIKSYKIKLLVQDLNILKSALLDSLNSLDCFKLGNLIQRIIKIFSYELDILLLRNLGIDFEFLKNLKLFHWPIEFPEIFKDSPGFDIIIGNPPFIRQEGINHIIPNFDYKHLLAKTFDIFDTTFDYSVYFILRSIKLLKKNGFHSFIITSKWLRAKYGNKIRNLFKNKTKIIRIVDFSGKNLFQRIAVDTIIYLIQLKSPEEESMVYYNRPNDLHSLNDNGYMIRQKLLGDNLWSFSDFLTYKIKDYLDKTTIKLKDFGVNIYFGIKTGYNKAFIIDSQQKEEIIGKNPRVLTFLKPLLRGKDIGKYYFYWKNLWLIVIPSGWTNKYIKNHNLDVKNAEKIFRETFPELYRYLMHIGEKTTGKGKGLFNRDDQGDYWWELRQCVYYSELEKPKLVWNRITYNVYFQLVPSGIYVLDSMFFIVGKHLKFLQLILQSSLNPFLMKNYCALLGNGYYAAAQYIEQIPIKKTELVNTFEIFADYLLFLNIIPENRIKLKEIITFLDKKIADCMVYELYFKDIFELEGLEIDFIRKISNYLVPINYDEFIDLYTKKLLKKPFDELKLIQIESENFETIKSVHKNIIEDTKILEQIKLIKSHPWIKKIENKQKI
ncbi:MAG: Eco57I restriction-modification methylase domain-containing protein [Candidatus Helarchaeota archaeon]